MRAAAPLTRLRRRAGIAAGVALACGLLAPTLLIGSPAAAVSSPRSTSSGSSSPGSSPSGSSSAVTPGSGPLSVAVVAPMTVPSTADGILDADTLEAYTAPAGLLTRQLAAVIGTPVAIGVDPMIVASIRVLGRSAPVSALDWLARLQSAPNQTFLLAYADADPALAADAGALDLFQPLDLGFAIDPANFSAAVTPSAAPTDGTGAPSTSPTPTSTPTAPPGEAPPLPPLGDLLAWSASLPPIAWPAAGPVSSTALDQLAGVGYGDVIVSSDAVQATDSAHVALGPLDAVVADADLSSLVGTAASAVGDSSAELSLAAVGAALDAEVATSPGRSVVVAIDRDWLLEAGRLGSVLALIEGSESSNLVPLSDVLAEPASAGSLAGTPDAGRVATVAALAESVRAVEQYVTIATDPLVVTGPERAAYLALLGAGWSGDAEWAGAVQDFQAAAATTTDAVAIANSTDLLSLSDRTNLPITITNALPVSIRVCVTVTPQRPILTVEDSATPTCVTVDADSRGAASVGVTSLANGEVPVRISLAGENGLIVGGPRYVTVNVQAGWETIGILVSVLLVVALFGTGVVRSILRRRRERRNDTGASAA